MGVLRLRTTRYEDLSLIADDMRAMDRLECEAFGLSPLDALRASRQRAVMAWTIEKDGRAAGMAGVGASGPFSPVGSPWMLGTDALQEERRNYLIAGRHMLAKIEAVYPRLQNWMHAENRASQRWVRRLGFVIDPKVVHVGGHPMLRFHKGFPCVSIPSRPPSP